jgi:hypothetical protein
VRVDNTRKRELLSKKEIEIMDKAKKNQVE